MSVSDGSNNPLNIGHEQALEKVRQPALVRHSLATRVSCQLDRCPSPLASHGGLQN